MASSLLPRSHRERPKRQRCCASCQSATSAKPHAAPNASAFSSCLRASYSVQPADASHLVLLPSDSCPVHLTQAFFTRSERLRIMQTQRYTNLPQELRGTFRMELPVPRAITGTHFAGPCILELSMKAVAPGHVLARTTASHSLHGRSAPHLAVLWKTHHTSQDCLAAPHQSAINTNSTPATSSE